MQIHMFKVMVNDHCLVNIDFKNKWQQWITFGKTRNVVHELREVKIPVRETHQTHTQ